MSKQTFESAMKKLENIVNELEHGELPLERAVKKFEEGINLSAYCSKTLEETEKRISLLLKEKNGHLSETSFEKTAE